MHQQHLNHFGDRVGFTGQGGNVHPEVKGAWLVHILLKDRNERFIDRESECQLIQLYCAASENI